MLSGEAKAKLNGNQSILGWLEQGAGGEFAMGLFVTQACWRSSPVVYWVAVRLPEFSGAWVEKDWSGAKSTTMKKIIWII
jgi:hypothetical protein